MSNGKVKLIVLTLTMVSLFAGAVYAGDLKNIVIISIDALHPDALRMAKIPTLQKLMHGGAYTLDGRSTEPPKTLIAHTAMFTGMKPIENGKMDNSWVPGQAMVDKPTIFNRARSYGFRTGYFYAKQKLGYLVNGAIDAHKWSRDNSIDLAEAFVKTPDRHFVFLHISGLDEVGPQYGWLSPEYLEELSFIDEYLSTLVDSIERQKNYLMIVTSDHAGHAKIHGSQYPEDYRLPFIISSDAVPIKNFHNMSFSVVDLKKILEKLQPKIGR
ncbi:MAG: alkaline phosphatase family protein [Desulfobacterales bacterium]|nr:alkaline phosphatase family protein [Desulfobacterales bacterium]